MALRARRRTPATRAPKGATPMRVSLVPAYNQCTSPNRVHGPPDFPGNASNPDGSCNPPAQTSASSRSAPPTPTAQAANSVGSVRLSVIDGNPATTADEADVRYQVSITDVRCKPGAGACGAANAAAEPTTRASCRRRPACGSPTATTAPPRSARARTPRSASRCRARPRPAPAIGSTCSIDTTADAVLPGVVKEIRRSIWQLGQVQVFDGGADGVVSTNPNTLFAVQGVFVP